MLRCASKKNNNKSKTRNKYQVSISGRKFLFDEDGSINPVAVSVLNLLAMKCDLFIIIQVSDDEEEKMFKSLCETAKITPEIVKPHVLY